MPGIIWLSISAQMTDFSEDPYSSQLKLNLFAIMSEKLLYLPLEDFGSDKYRIVFSLCESLLIFDAPCLFADIVQQLIVK